MTLEYGTVTLPVAMVGNRSATIPPTGSGLSPTAIGLQATAYVILFIIGVILNTCVLLVVYKNRTMRNVTNMFIVSLSVVDLATLLAVVPFVIAATVADGWPFGGEFCQFSGFLAVSLRNVSIISVAGVAVDRYFVIVRPFAPKVTKSRAWKLIAFIWWTGFISCVPPLFGFGMYTYSAGKHFCALHWGGGGSALAYSMYLVSVIFLGSLVVVIFSYYLIIQTTREQMKKSTLNGLSPNARNSNGVASPVTQGKPVRSPTLSSIVPVENRTTQTVILVILAFLITWTPYFLLNLYRGLAQDKTIVAVGDFITTWLSFSCCVFNPILYGALNYRFRKSFQELCSNWTFSLSRVTEFLERMKGGQGSGRRDGSRYVPEQPEGGTLSRSYENTPVARRSQKTLTAGGPNGQAAGLRQDRSRRAPGVRTLERRPSLPTTRTESSLARGVYVQNGVHRPGSSLARNLQLAPRAGSTLGRSVTPTGTPRIPPSLVRSRTPTSVHRLMYSLPRSTTPTTEITLVGSGRVTPSTTPRLPPRPPSRTEHHPRPSSRNDQSQPRSSSRNGHPHPAPTRNDYRPPSRNESPLQSTSGNSNPPLQLSRTVADVHLEAVF